MKRLAGRSCVWLEILSIVLSRQAGQLACSGNIRNPNESSRKLSAIVYLVRAKRFKKMESSLPGSIDKVEVAFSLLNLLQEMSMHANNKKIQAIRKKEEVELFAFMCYLFYLVHVLFPYTLVVYILSHIHSAVPHVHKWHHRV